MVIERLTKGFFSSSFKNQLKSCLKCSVCDDTNTCYKKYANNSCINFSFILPACKRFSYTEYLYIYKELLDTFLEFYPCGVKIVYIKPNFSDDHYIDVGIIINSLMK